MTRYEDVKKLSTEEYFKNNQFSVDAFKKKYTLHENETYVQAAKRVCDFIASVEKTDELKKYWSERWFDEIFNDWWHPAGSIMQGAGSGKKISTANCFSVDTEFITDKGVASFKSFKDGDLVNVLSSYGGFKEATIKCFGPQKLAKVTIMRNSIYKEIDCTWNHDWRTLDGESILIKQTSELRAGDELPYIKRKWMENKEGRYFCPMGFIHGLVFGDGTYYKKYDYCNLDLCGDSKQFLKFFKGFDWVIHESDEKTRIRYLPNYMKQMPDFKAVNSEYVLGFLMGWFASDGTVDPNGRATLYHNNKENLKKIMDVMESLGIYSTGNIRVRRETDTVVIQGKEYSNREYKLYSINFVKDCMFKSFFVKENHKKYFCDYINNLVLDKRKTNWKVMSVENADKIENVWCVIEPECHNFTLRGGVSTNNCTHNSLGGLADDEEWDNLESIIKNTTYTVAKCAAYRQGLGVDFSRLRPVGTKVMNSANESTGVIHWMKFVDSIGYYVGQKGRIPAMLFSLSIKHPDVVKFIGLKSDYTQIQNANISVQCTDDFYKAVEANEDWTMKFEIPAVKKGDKIHLDQHSINKDCNFDTESKRWYKIATHTRKKEVITKTVNARELMLLIAKNMHQNAEPGIQNIDIARKYSNSDAMYDPSDEYDSRIIGTNAPLVGDTLIPTPSGIFSIRKLYEQGETFVLSDSIVTLPPEVIDHNYPKTIYGKYNFPTKTFPVSAKFKKYENQQVWILKTNTGQEFKCNGEHKWLINGEMISTKDIQIGDKLFKPNGGIVQACDYSIDTTSKDFNLGEIVGYIVGDGWIGKESNIHNKMIGILYDEDCRHYADSFRILYSNITGESLTYERKRNTIFETRSENKKFIEFFEQYGLIDSKYVVPSQCYTNLTFCAGYLRGLFQADGCMQWNDRQGRLILTTVSNDIAIGVCELLQNWFGIHSTIKISDSKGVPYGDGKISNFKTRYDVNISTRQSLVRFKQYIGLLGKKGEVLSKVQGECKKYNNRIALLIDSVTKTDVYEDMYCAEIAGLHAFVVNGCISSNCSEQYLSRDSLCVLGSINCGKFSTSPEIYFAQLEKIGKSINRFLDNVNQCELEYQTYATPHQKMAIEKLRRTGAGVTNIAAWLFKKNLVYGTPEANDAFEEYMKVYNYWMYIGTEELGKEKGNFGLFNEDKWKNALFISRIMKESRNISKKYGGPVMKGDSARNVTCSSIAPTGTLTLMFRDTAFSYGIEPAFFLSYWKRTRMGGTYEYYFNVPNVVREMFAQAGFPIPMESDTIKDDWDGTQGKAINKFIDEHIEKIGIKFKTSTEIKALDKLQFMSQVMNWVDSSISVTYMLPEGSTTEDVYNFIMEAHKKEVKSIAAFPDKKMYGIVSQISFKDLALTLKEQGVAIHHQNFSDDELKVMNISRENIVETAATCPKRLSELDADIHVVAVKGEKFCIVVGLQNGLPYEIFGGHLNGLGLKGNYKKGKLIKIKRGQYSLEFDDISIEDFSKQFTPTEQILFRMASMSMRHGVPLKFIVEQLQKATDDIMSMASAASRVLKKYIPDGEQAVGQVCPSCGSKNLFYNSGCVSCECGWSKCS